MPCTRKNQCKYETFSLITQDQSRCMLIPHQVNLCLYPSFATSAVCMNLGMFLSSLCLSFSICKMAISSVQSLSRVWLLQPHGLQHTRLPCPSPTPWGGNSSTQNSNQFSSVIQPCPTLCNPMNCTTPGLPVHHQLPESTPNQNHRVGDAIQPYHPLSSPSPPALNLSQHQGLFKWVSSLHQVAKALEFQLQHQSLQWTPKTDLL